MTSEPKKLFNNICNKVAFYIKNENEAQNITKILLNHFLNINLSDIIINKSIEISEKQYKNLNEAINKIKENEPIQYIIGKITFLDNDFIVNKNVLIPRPETEELVNLIISENKNKNKTKNLKILDIGTGSGCIAITLKKYLKNVKIDAIDISKEALEVAHKNAHSLNSDVNFYKLDILQDKLLRKQWDIIVSNPPYVRLSEKNMMKKNVLDYEPQNAIFVSDKEPLIFYKKIADISKNHLLKNGIVYAEINENLGKQTASIFKSKSAKKVEIIKDLHNKERFIKAEY